MANIVNLQQSEYDTVIEQLTAAHMAAIEKIVNLKAKVIELSGKNGELYADMISSKVEFLMDSLQTDILNQMTMNFSASETAMSDFAQIILNLDSGCSLEEV